MLNKMLTYKKYFILFDQVVFSGTSFAINILLAKNINIGLFGLFSGFILGLYLLIGLMSAIIIQPFQVNIVRVEKKESYISFCFWTQIMGLLLLLPSIYLIAHYFVNDTLPLAGIPFAIGFGFHDYIRKQLLALDKPLQTFIIDIISGLSQLAAIAFFIYQDNGTLNQLFAYLSSTYLMVFIASFVVLKPFQIQLSQWKTFAINHIKQGKWLLVTAIVQWWSGNLFVVASGIYLGAEALGALRLVQSLFGVLNVLLQTFENYVLPQTAKILMLDKEKAITYLITICKKTAILFMPILLLIFTFSTELISLFGSKNYSPYAYVINWMLVLYVLVYISQPIRISMRALLLNQYFFFGYVLSLLFSLIYSHYLLSNYGLTGVLIGLISSQIILIAFWQFILNKNKFYLWKSFISY